MHFADYFVAYFGNGNSQQMTCCLLREFFLRNGQLGHCLHTKETVPGYIYSAVVCGPNFKVLPSYKAVIQVYIFAAVFLIF